MASDYLEARKAYIKRQKELIDEYDKIAKLISDMSKVPLLGVLHRSDLSEFRCSEVDKPNKKILVRKCKGTKGEKVILKSFIDMGTTPWRLEIENLMRVNSPYVVKLLFISDNFTFGMERYGINDLRNYADKVYMKGGIPMDMQKSILRQVCLGLKDIHAAGLVHCDMKPGNIMIDSDGGVKIIDLGIAELIGTSSMTMPTTAPYCEPQMYGRTDLLIMPKMDVWSLGITMIDINISQYEQEFLMQYRKRTEIMSDIASFLGSLIRGYMLEEREVTKFVIENMLILDREKRCSIDDVLVWVG